LTSISRAIAPFSRREARATILRAQDDLYQEFSGTYQKPLFLLCLPIQKLKVQRYKGTEIPVPRAAGLVLKSGTLRRSKGGFIGYSVAQHVPELLTPQTHPKHCTFGGEFSYL
jgi:hypothetical protein